MVPVAHSLEALAVDVLVHRRTVLLADAAASLDLVVAPSTTSVGDPVDLAAPEVVVLDSPVALRVALAVSLSTVMEVNVVALPVRLLEVLVAVAAVNSASGSVPNAVVLVVLPVASSVDLTAPAVSLVRVSVPDVAVRVVLAAASSVAPMVLVARRRTASALAPVAPLQTVSVLVRAVRVAHHPMASGPDVAAQVASVVLVALVVHSVNGLVPDVATRVGRLRMAMAVLQAHPPTAQGAVLVMAVPAVHPPMGEADLTVPAALPLALPRKVDRTIRSQPHRNRVRRVTSVVLS